MASRRRFQPPYRRAKAAEARTITCETIRKQVGIKLCGTDTYLDLAGGFRKEAEPVLGYRRASWRKGCSTFQVGVGWSQGKEQKEHGPLIRQGGVRAEHEIVTCPFVLSLYH